MRAQSKYLTPKHKESLIKFYSGKTLFGINLERAEIIDEGDGICRSCMVEEFGLEVEDHLRHAVYECPTVTNIRLQVLHEFELQNETLSFNIGSIVLNQMPSDENRSINTLVNTIWSMLIAEVLDYHQSKKIPRTDLIISQIKENFRTILRNKPTSEISLTLKSRNLIKMLNSGFSPHEVS